MCKENLKILDKFIGHKIELCNKDHSITYQYGNFHWYVNYKDDLVLMNEKESDCKTYIPISQIGKISNIAENVHDDVVSIKFDGQGISLCSVDIR